MALSLPNQITPPTSGVLPVTAFAIGADQVDETIHFTKFTKIMFALGKKPSAVGTLEVLTCPDPDAWGAEEASVAAIAGTTVLEKDTAFAVVAPGYIRVKSVGADAGFKGVTLYTAAYNVQGG